METQHVPYVPPAPATGRRKFIYNVGIALGVVLVAFAWLLVGLGVIPATPTDDILAVVVLFALFSPWAAFLDNPGETRTRTQRFAEFAFGWLLLSGIAQTFWEIPWFFMDLTGIVQGIGPDDRWLWPWWTYGVADTRYLTSNPAIAGIEFCAGTAGPFELLACWLFYKGRRIEANWLALLLGVGLTWGTLVFFWAEVHVGFVNVKDGAFGFWVKWFGLNLPWMLSPFFFIPASIWELAELYEARGEARALARERVLEKAPEPVMEGVGVPSPAE